MNKKKSLMDAYEATINTIAASVYQQEAQTAGRSKILLNKLLENGTTFKGDRQRLDTSQDEASRLEAMFGNVGPVLYKIAQEQQKEIDDLKDAVLKTSDVIFHLEKKLRKEKKRRLQLQHESEASLAAQKKISKTHFELLRLFQSTTAPMLPKIKKTDDLGMAAKKLRKHQKKIRRIADSQKLSRLYLEQKKTAE